MSSVSTTVKPLEVSGEAAPPRVTPEQAGRAGAAIALGAALLLHLAYALQALRWAQGLPFQASVEPNPFLAATSPVLVQFGAPFVVGLVYLGIGLLALSLRGQTLAGRVLAFFCATAAVGLAGLFDLYTSRALTWAWTVAVPLAGAALVTLGLVFPYAIEPLRKRPALVLLPFVLALLVAAYSVASLLIPRAGLPAWRSQSLPVDLAALGLGLAFCLSAAAYRFWSSPSPLVREQSQIVLLGALVAFALPTVWAVQRLRLGCCLAPDPLRDYPLLALFPAAAAFALLRRRLLDTDSLTGQALIYTALAAFALMAYTLILTGASLLFGAAMQASHPIVLGLLVFVLVVALHPLRERLQAQLDETFFRGSRAFRQSLEAFSRAVTGPVSLDGIVRALDQQVEAALRPSHLHLYLYDNAAGDYSAYERPEDGHGSGGAREQASLSHTHIPTYPHTELRFPANSPLAATLSRDHAALVLTPGSSLPAALQADRARLAVLGSAVFAPLPATGPAPRLIGWLALGPKLSGQPLARADVRFVQALADRAAPAVERAAVIADLERRVRELNVLSQMSQAVNFTLAYDDLLELIFAQASKVVDTRNFYILLKDEAGLNFRYVLFVEDDERDNAQENKPFPIGRGLSSVIQRTGQPIRTDDYLAECRRRGVAPRARQADFKAWMGVPLNAGADTIGAMVVASQTPEVSFSEDQLKIFTAVADQAASALVRARLYQKSEERARQLSTLNELSTSMASYLELDPLLERIVSSSMNMLDCEAGSLFLTDEETGEYVFRVAAGPVGQNLIGMRIAPGKGFVGEAIETGQVLIVNDVQNDPRWFKGSDQSTGFVTQALMVVPLQRGDRTIGALEVINRRDRSPFDQEDRRLLAAFAGQATVAIENARLFADTDQALAERVSELSVMQRIDRQLNEGLDVQRVMSITLDWALRNTHATAGSVGMVTGQGIQIIATHGYGDTVEQLRDRPLSIERGLMGRVVRTGQLSLVRDVRADPDYRGILPSTRCQLTIPIVRDGNVVGLINLESPDASAFTDEQVGFVTRLLDHAAVAITNARLYAEVTAANVAKSDFVSIAAHELKTPMTSIKMAAELMLSGAVGSFNDTQKQFLNTIRNNLDRMTTIVSDLNDITRIETGRLRLDIRPFPLQTIIDEMLRATRGLLEAKQQTLVLEIAPGLPDVLADSNRAAQVLTNLLSNAYKYTPEKGEIRLRAGLSAERPGQLHLAVHDNGIGISDEDQDRLFQKFFRSDDRAAREMAAGTGLGLSIVKNLVELQGGTIWVESEFRKGSTFHFTLPLSPQPVPVPQPEPA